MSEEQYLAKERHQVMFTKREHINVLHNHHLIMVLIKNCIIEYIWGKRRLFMEEENERSSLNSILDYRITNGRH